MRLSFLPNHSDGRPDSRSWRRVDNAAAERDRLQDPDAPPPDGARRGRQRREAVYAQRDALKHRRGKERNHGEGVIRVTLLTLSIFYRVTIQVVL